MQYDLPPAESAWMMCRVVIHPWGAALHPQDLDSPLIAPTFTDGYHAYKDVPYEQSTVSERGTD